MPARFEAVPTRNVVAVLATAAALACVAVPQPIPSIRYSISAACPPPYDEIGGECHFKLGDSEFKVAQSGEGRRTLGSQVTGFSLDLLEGEWIEDLAVAEYEGDVILFTSVTDGESGGSVLVRLDGEHLFADWYARIPAFNLSVAAIEPGAIYVGAFSLVTRIDPASGRFEWLHGNLYDSRSGRFNAFITPNVGSTCVVFREWVDPVSARTPEEVWIDKVTGERLSGRRLTDRCS